MRRLLLSLLLLPLVGVAQVPPPYIRNAFDTNNGTVVTNIVLSLIGSNQWIYSLNGFGTNTWFWTTDALTSDLWYHNGLVWSNATLGGLARMRISDALGTPTLTFNGTVLPSQYSGQSDPALSVDGVNFASGNLVQYRTNGTVIGGVKNDGTLFGNGPLYLTNIGASKLVRTDSSKGLAPVTVGSGLSFDGTTLSASGGGTVTSVGISGPSIISWANSPVTTSGTLTGTLANQNANTVLAGPASGSAATPAFRALTSADIPTPANLTANYAQGLVFDDFSQYTGNAPTINGGYNWSAQSAVVTGTYGIVTNTTDASGSINALAITNGEIKRTFPWGAKWKKLRIGVLFRIQTNATFSCDATLGICSGTANGWGSSSCANAIGWNSAQGNANAWTYNAGTDYAYFTPTFTSFATKHNTTITDLSPTGTGSPRPSGTSTGRSAFIIQITRARLGTTSNTYVTSEWSVADMSTTGDQSDYDNYTLLQDLVSTTQGILIPGTASLTKSSSFDETNGALDTFNFWWGGTTAAIELDLIAVMRFY